MQIKAAIKRVIPQRLLAYRRLGKERSFVKYEIKDFEKGLDQHAIVLIGTPLHENLGDHLITLGTREFLATAFPDKKVIEIPLEAYRLFLEKSQKGDVEEQHHSH